MKSFMTSLVAVVLVACTASFASATATVLHHDFENASGVGIEGLVANTGQVWADSWDPGDLQGNTLYGQGGSTGVGGHTEGSWYVNKMTFAPISGTSPITSSIDIKRASPGANRMGGGLGDSINSQSFSYSFWDSNTLSVEGNLVSTQAINSSVFGATDLHLALSVDRVTKTVGLSWYEIGNPGNNDSQNLGSYTGTFSPDNYSLLVYGRNNAQGFDNLLVTIPEPTSLAMVCVSGLLVCMRRRRS